MPKILGVDDSATMRRILEMTFTGDANSSITTVGDGNAAMRWASDNGPDLVLADGSMPGTDGYELARALRSNPATQGVAVIVLASQHHPFDAEKAKQCGVDDHVLKPFETQGLIDKVRDVLSRPRATATRAVAAAPAAPAPPRPAAPPATPAVAGPRPAPSPGTPGVVSPRPAAPPAQALPAQPIRATAAFGSPVGARPPTASTAPSAATMPRPQTAAPAPAMVASAASATASNGEMASRLSGMGLTPAQIEGVLALSREVIERVVWEVVPDLAETIIKEEIRRLTSES